MMKKDKKNNSVMKNFKGCAPMSIGLSLSSNLSFGYLNQRFKIVLKWKFDLNHEIVFCLN